MTARPQRAVHAYVPDRKPTLTQRTIMKPIDRALWDGWKRATDYISGLSDRKLWQLREAVEAFGMTNIGWLPFMMKRDLLAYIEWETKRREGKKNG